MIYGNSPRDAPRGPSRGPIALDTIKSLVPHFRQVSADPLRQHFVNDDGRREPQFPGRHGIREPWRGPIPFTVRQARAGKLSRKVPWHVAVFDPPSHLGQVASFPCCRKRWSLFDRHRRSGPSMARRCCGPGGNPCAQDRYWLLRMGFLARPAGTRFRGVSSRRTNGSGSAIST